MESETFESVWDALCDTPEEAANMKVRAELLIDIRERVKAWDLSPEKAAKRLRLTRPRLNDLLRCNAGEFSLDALVVIATAAGLALHIEVTDLTDKRRRG
nr:XRE family transcriptional regulator [Sedimenticola hydrogenitrophicus]